MYQEFFVPEFDASRFANNIIQSSAIAASLQQVCYAACKT